MKNDFSHTPVMPEEVITGLSIKPNGVYVDATVGGAGHAGLIAEQLTSGILVGIDRDAAAVARAQAVLAPYGAKCRVVRSNHKQARQVLHDLHIPVVDGVLLDLGVSSHQLDTPERGFSYRHDAPLDMRMDDRDPLTAYDVVNHYTEQRLIDIFFAYGEERYSKRIARALVNNRLQAPIATTAQLVALVTEAVPVKARLGGHPAKRVFQAIRIEVNDELQKLDATIRDMVYLLKPGGRIACLTFHSLEDRIVKHVFRAMANPCDCPRDLPVCVCGKKPLVTVLTRKPVTAGETELAENPRAHSAKLRIAERTEHQHR